MCYERPFLNIVGKTRQPRKIELSATSAKIWDVSLLGF